MVRRSCGSLSGTVMFTKNSFLTRTGFVRVHFYPDYEERRNAVMDDP